MQWMQGLLLHCLNFFLVLSYNKRQSIVIKLRLAYLYSYAAIGQIDPFF